MTNRRFRLIYGDQRPKEEYGLGMDFLLGPAIVRLELDIEEGTVGLEFRDKRDTQVGRKQVWHLKRRSTGRTKAIFSGLGLTLTEFMFWEGPASEMFRQLRVKMSDLLGDDGDEQ